MRILFIGCVKSSAVLLEELLKKGFDVVGVITKSESSFNSDYTDLSDICRRNNLEYIYVNNVNEQKSLDFARKLNPDYIYCFGWSELIKRELLSVPKNGVIGFHPAELPNNRGRHPTIWALVLGLKQTASSFFIIDEYADRGAIISQELIEISYNDDANSLYDKILSVAKKQVADFSTKLENGTCPQISQDASAGNSWRKRGMKDGEIDWRMSSYAIYNLVRALTKPYVGAHFSYGDKQYKVWKVEEVSADNLSNIEPGKVLDVISDTEYYVKAYDNIVHVMSSDPIKLNIGDYL